MRCTWLYRTYKLAIFFRLFVAASAAAVAAAVIIIVKIDYSVAQKRLARFVGFFQSNETSRRRRCCRVVITTKTLLL